MIWLNREYKPLGIACESLHTDHWVNYLNFPWLTVLVDDPRVSRVVDIPRVVGERGTNQAVYFLFNDLNPPWAEKRHALAYLKVIEEIIADAKARKKLLPETATFEIYQFQVPDFAVQVTSPTYDDSVFEQLARALRRAFWSSTVPFGGDPDEASPEECLRGPDGGMFARRLSDNAYWSVWFDDDDRVKYQAID